MKNRIKENMTVGEFLYLILSVGILSVIIGIALGFTITLSIF